MEIMAALVCANNDANRRNISCQSIDIPISQCLKVVIPAIAVETSSPSSTSSESANTSTSSTEMQGQDSETSSSWYDKVWELLAIEPPASPGSKSRTNTDDDEMVLKIRHFYITELTAQLERSRFYSIPCIQISVEVINFCLLRYGYKNRQLSPLLQLLVGYLHDSIGDFDSAITCYSEGNLVSQRYFE